MRIRASFLVILVGVVMLLTPLAYASPPDPSWIRGMYDDGDFDNVVVLITSGAGAVQPFPLSEVDSVLPVITWPSASDEQPVPSHALSALRARSPPLV